MFAFVEDGHRFFARLRLLMPVALLCAVFAISCGKSEGGHAVQVRVFSDFVPGPEAGLVSTTLLLGSGPAARALEAREAQLLFSSPLSRGVTVAAFEHVPQGTQTLRVELRRPNATLLVGRDLIVEVAADTTYTVHLNADCAAVSCPSASGSPAFTACLAGECVDPRCSASTPEFCPSTLFCREDVDCDGSSSCAATSCMEGVCEFTPRENACDATEYCARELGCVPRDRMDEVPQPQPTCGLLCAMPNDECWYHYYACDEMMAEPVCVKLVARPDGAPCGDGWKCAAGQCVMPSAPDAGVDASADAAVDAALDDASMDAAVDASVDAADAAQMPDVPAIAPPDADAIDASSDADPAVDLGMDALIDATADALGADVLDAAADSAPDAEIVLIDECETLTEPCFPGVLCTDLEVGYTCGDCPLGYRGDGHTCEDIDECAEDLDQCDLLVSCTNFAGGYACGNCPPGYGGGGRSGCVDIDECMNGGCSPLVSCDNTPGSFTCGACPSGYSGNGRTCTDVNECATNTDDCDDLVSCTNVEGSFECGDCPSTYTMSGGHCVCNSGLIDCDGSTSNGCELDQNATCYVSDNLCHPGTPACVSGSATCGSPSTTLSPGTSCGTGHVCSTGGDCIACVNGGACTVSSPAACTTGAGTWSGCGTGAPTCNPVSGSYLPANTSCGANKICNAFGSCNDSVVWRSFGKGAGSVDRTYTANDLCVLAGFTSAVYSHGYYHWQCAGPMAGSVSATGRGCASYDADNFECMSWCDRLDCTGANYCNYSGSRPTPDWRQRWGDGATSYTACEYYTCSGWNPGWSVRLRCQY